jgi:hypothetical protein
VIGIIIPWDRGRPRPQFHSKIKHDSMKAEAGGEEILGDFSLITTAVLT